MLAGKWRGMPNASEAGRASRDLTCPEELAHALDQQNESGSRT